MEYTAKYLREDALQERNYSRSKISDTGLAFMRCNLKEKIRTKS